MIVADDGSRDGTAAAAREAGAVVARAAARAGRARRCRPPSGRPARAAAARGRGPRGRPHAVARSERRPRESPRSRGGRAAASASRSGRGRALDPRCARGTSRASRSPASGLLSPAARAARASRSRRGSACETRMTIDAVRAGLAVEEVELELAHRATGRDLAGFLHRGRQLLDARPRGRAARRQPPRVCDCRSSAGSSARGPSRSRGGRDRARRRPLERLRARLPRRTCGPGARPAC